MTAATPFTVPGDAQLALPGAVPVFFRTPLLEVAATSRVVRFAGGGDSLRVGHGAIWLTDYRAGTLSRIRTADALPRR